MTKFLSTLLTNMVDALFPPPPPMRAAVGALSPSVAEFLYASVGADLATKTAGDLVALTQNGRQIVGYDEAAGFMGDAWLTPSGQVIVAIAGTDGIDPTGNFNLTLAADQIAADVNVPLGTTPAGFTAALAFTRQILAYTATRGIPASDVFVTGHSFGGNAAEYVAQQTGLPGMAFEAAGIAPSATAIGTGKNFVDVITYGDPAANDSSDIAAEQPFAPAYVRGGGVQPHYGQILWVGDPAWQNLITLGGAATVATPGAPVTLGSLFNGINSAAAATLLACDVLFHSPATQAHALGITFPADLSGAYREGVLSVQTGPVLDVGTDTLPQILQFIAASNGNYQTSPASAITGPVATAERALAGLFAPLLAA